MIFALLLLSLPLHAGQCPVPADGSPALARVDSARRLEWLQARLSETARRARLWSWVWAVGPATASAVNFTLAATADDSGKRYDRVIGGLAGLVSPAAKLLNPMKVIADSEKAATLPSSCDGVSEAEELFRRDARDVESKLPLQYLGTAVVALAGGVALAAVGHAQPAILQASATLVSGGIQAWTMPTALRDDWRTYLGGELAPAATSAWELAPLAGDGLWGARLALRF